MRVFPPVLTTYAHVVYRQKLLFSGSAKFRKTLDNTPLNEAHTPKLELIGADYKGGNTDNGCLLKNEPSW